ncbi:MAG TPA: deoxyribonuclease IV [Candidatus Xenobia bacterium]
MARTPALKPLLGAHCSTAGAYTHALECARAVRAECLQIFTHAPGRWVGRDIGEEEAAAFRQAASRYRHVLAHDIYLTNLASPDEALRRRSIETLVEERRRCLMLGVTGLVCHMGAHLGQGVRIGLRRYAAGLREVLQRSEGVPILLESSAGQGSCLGCRFEDIAEVLEYVEGDVGVCLDTCHLFAAGYDLEEATWQEFDSLIGFDRLKALHLNDSQKPLGSRVDRHEHIGQGCIGEEPFRRILQDGRFAGLPMVVETENDEGRGHARDLRVLKRLRLKREDLGR